MDKTKTVSLQLTRGQEAKLAPLLAGVVIEHPTEFFRAKGWTFARKAVLIQLELGGPPTVRIRGTARSYPPHVWEAACKAAREALATSATAEVIDLPQPPKTPTPAPSVGKQPKNHGGKKAKT